MKQIMTPGKNFRFSGQSLSEYVLPVCLVALIGITGLKLLGDLVSGGLNSVVPGTSQSGSKAVALTNNSNSALNPYPSLPAQSLSIKLANGKTIPLQITDMAAVAEAAGGNGVTTSALAAIDNLIAEMVKAEGDPDQISALRKLSEEGHKIKELQKAVSDIFPAEGFKNYFEISGFAKTKTVMVDGQEISMIEAAKRLRLDSITVQLGSIGDPHVDLNILEKDLSHAMEDYNNGKYNNQQIPEHSLASFLKQLSNVKASGLFEQNPGLEALVKDNLSKAIMLSSFQTVTAPTKDDMKQLITITKHRSNDICTVSKAMTCQDKSG